MWEMVIGLEVHAQIASRTKLFSCASALSCEEPNTNVVFFDAAMPGMLPVLNKHCVDLAIKTAIGCNATVNLISEFDRKNYFYPDLPSGYQISQFYHPIASDGFIKLSDSIVRINRLHLEQDAGKSIHDRHPQETYVDLNRAGVGLMEIVSEPDITSIEQAIEYIKELRLIMRYLGTCDGNMEKGNFRVDVNISMNRKGEPMGTRCELKNINSFKFIAQAIEFERNRQIDLLSNNEKIIQETRLFDPETKTTRTMRDKENARDYRYFPDPDLPPLVLKQEHINNIKDSIPELPQEKRKRYAKEFMLQNDDIELIVSDVDYASFFEATIRLYDNYKGISNWLLSEVLARMNGSIGFMIAPQTLADLVRLIDDGTISGKIAKELLDILWHEDQDVLALIDKMNLRQISDEAAINTIVQKILDDEQEKVVQYHGGKDKLFGFFVGAIMKATKGKANPSLVNEILIKNLENGKNKI